MPGDPLVLLAGEEVAQLTPQQRAAVRAAAGLDRPLPVQYGSYLKRTLRGDLGNSYQQRRPIAALLAERLPWTLLLTGGALLLSAGLGVGAAALAAGWRGGRADSLLLTLFVAAESLPAFWVGMLLIALFAVRWPLFPAFGAQTPWLALTGWQRGLDVLHHLALPLATLTVAGAPGFFLVARAALRSVADADFVAVA